MCRETIAIEAPQSFFHLLDQLTDPQWSPLREAETDEDTYRRVLETTLESGYLLKPGELASFEMTHALHAAVPRIEAAYQYYNDTQAGRAGDCESWVDWYGEVVCDVETLKRLVGVETIEATEASPRDRCVPKRSDTPKRDAHHVPCSPLPHVKHLPFDHVLPSPESTLTRPPRAAILYADVSSPAFRPLHEFLQYACLQHASSSEGPHLEYIFRHVAPKGYGSSTERTYLSGYGVALDLKKMDYLALDDRRQGACSLTLRRFSPH